MAHPNPVTARLNVTNAAGAMERETEVIRLKAQGWTFERIAAQLEVHPSTASSLFYRAMERRRAQNEQAIETMVEARVAQFEANLTELSDIIDAEDTPLPQKLKAIAQRVIVIDKIAKLRGEYPAERLAVLTANVGGPSQGRDIPDEELDAMTDEQLVALRTGHRAAMLQAVTVEVTKQDDPEPDDGSPPELEFQDPGPHAVVVADAGGDRADPEEAEEEPDGGG